jgi:uncharacterized cupin superfamily protein
MTTRQLHKFADSSPAEEYFLPADKLLAGNPKQTVWLHYADAGNQFFAGIWRSEPGKWKISYTEEEFCEIQSGSSVITDADGQSVAVAAGECFVIPRGFVGTWEVVATTTKRFVIYEAGSAPK